MSHQPKSISCRQTTRTESLRNECNAQRLQSWRGRRQRKKQAAMVACPKRTRMRLVVLRGIIHEPCVAICMRVCPCAPVCEQRARVLRFWGPIHDDAAGVYSMHIIIYRIPMEYTHTYIHTHMHTHAPARVGDFQARSRRRVGSDGCLPPFLVWPPRTVDA